MINKLLLIGLASITSSFGVTILNQANWDGIDELNDGNNGAAVTEVLGAGAPAGSNGTVAAIDLSGGNVWGALNPPGNTIDIPAGVIAGTDTFTATFRLFIPSSTTFTETDRVNLIVRRNNNNAGGTFANNNVWNTLAADTWHTISMTETVPEFENDGTTPVTGFTPILSFYDRTDGANAEAGAGVAAYIDDWSFSVTTSAIPEPSASFTMLLGLGLLGLRRKR
ncbi:MAG: PEP-CTERM sorting domain-containing protein [Verrucomicrobiaceae bacterium]